MPELPDLTVFAENLHQRLAGKKVAEARLHLSPRSNSAQRDVSNSVEGAAIERIERVGKEVGFRLSNGNLLIIHLMLTGGFAITTAEQSVPSPVLSLRFTDDAVLTVFDPKGWAKVTINPDSSQAAADALDITADHLRRIFAKRGRMVTKAFLIDQSLIRGIGNAYADEILWEARISPKSVVGKLPPEAVNALAAAIRSVLKNATQHLRKNHPGIIAGEIRDFLAVHNNSRDVSPTGHPIKREQVASKTTYYTDEQALYK